MEANLHNRAVACEKCEAAGNEGGAVPLAAGKFNAEGETGFQLERKARPTHTTPRGAWQAVRSLPLLEVDDH